MALGLSGGAIVGLAVRGARLAAQARAMAVAVPLAMLGLTVMFSCGAAWVLFTEYLGPTAWVWFGAGILAGLILGELAVRLGSGQHSKANTPTHHPPP
jgi:hypothetical protein